MTEVPKRKACEGCVCVRPSPGGADAGRGWRVGYKAGALGGAGSVPPGCSDNDGQRRRAAAGGAGGGFTALGVGGPAPR